MQLGIALKPYLHGAASFALAGEYVFHWVAWTIVTFYVTCEHTSKVVNNTRLWYSLSLTHFQPLFGRGGAALNVHKEKLVPLLKDLALLC